MIARESGYFTPVATSGHRTPATAVRARIIIEKQTTLRIGTKPQARAWAFGHSLRRGPGHGREQPVKAGLSGDKFDLPEIDRKSTRLNSSHTVISYAVFCLKKKTEPV